MYMNLKEVERTDKYFRGFGFIEDKLVCEYIYYLDGSSILEAYDILELETRVYVNVLEFEVQEVLENEFFWGV